MTQEPGLQACIVARLFSVYKGRNPFTWGCGLFLTSICPQALAVLERNWFDLRRRYTPMHKRLYARCDLVMKITARSPLLVQGAQTDEQKGVFFKARDPVDGGREKYCIPATTLKGVWRSAAERILRSFDPVLACDPFEEDKEHQGKASKSCSKRLEDQPASGAAPVYAAMCPVCRLFGCTAHAGLLELADAWAVGNPSTMQHTGIAVDRFTGGVKQHALYSYEALAAGAIFSTRLTIVNVELWQIGLLALVCREMSAGQVLVGSGTRRGLGHVTVDWTRASFRYPKARYDRAHRGKDGALGSAQALAEEGELVAYQSADPWLMPGLEPKPAPGWADATWTTFELTDEALARLAKDCVELALGPKLSRGPMGFAYTPPAAQEVSRG
jgi:CRISPR-associated RAMP protein (TIGR02581 family)